MTTGQILNDFRQLHTFHSASCYPDYTVLLGRQTDRTWSGEDYPSINPKPRTTPYSPPFLTRGVRGPVSYAYRERYAANGYRRLPKRAYVVDHNYTTMDFKRSTGHARWHEYYPNCNWEYVERHASFATAFGGVTHSFNWTSNDDLALLGRLREKVQGEGWNAGVMAAEAGQGLQLVAKGARDINRAYGNVRRGNIVGAWRNLTGLGTLPPYVKRRIISENMHDAKVVAHNWLALQYGWKPLLADIHDAAAVLGHLLNTPLSRTVRASRRVPGTISCVLPYVSPSGAKCYTRTSVIARIKEVSVPQLLGLTSPWDILWEKTPFSFVADWFIPIGSWLSARGLASSLEATYVFSKKHLAQCYGIQVDTALALPFGFSDLTIEDFEYSWCAFTRTVETDPLIPLPALKPLGKWGSWERAASAVSLLITNFGSVGRGNTGRNPNFGR